MSFGEGDLHVVVAQLKTENARLKQQLGAMHGSEREAELRDALNYVADKWAIAQVQAADSARRCKLLEALVRDWQELYGNPDYGECLRLIDRMRKLGIEVNE